MPKITKISAQQKDKNRVSIFVDDEYAFSLTINQLLDVGIKVAQELSETEVTRFKKLSDDGKLYQKVLDKLARRQHSIREIERYLSQKEATDDYIHSVIEKLSTYGYLNDQAFAEAWVNNGRALKKRSNRMLRAELLKKGVASTIIDTVLEDSKESELEALRLLVEKKSKITRYQDKNAMTQFLLRRGFSYDAIKTVLDV